MKRILIGLVVGAFAGVIDMIPMVIRKLPVEAEISAFIMWIVAGFFVSTVDLKTNPLLKGIIVAVLVLLPCAILIGWNDPAALIPISLMTIVLGGLVGFSVNALSKQNRND
ncbi:MAG TPA: hypothetical protein PLR88_10060 [Bacteroidales bacterium]|nr:hypothetical protein [Bacteroidales bacterium]